MGQRNERRWGRETESTKPTRTFCRVGVGRWPLSVLAPAVLADKLLRNVLMVKNADLVVLPLTDGTVDKVFVINVIMNFFCEELLGHLAPAHAIQGLK